LLDFGNKLFPELKKTFIDSPDKSVAEIPSAAQLRSSWSQVNGVLGQKFSGMQPAEWFLKHTAVSAEDFVKEPHRNKLNIVLTRASHLSYHTGQFILLK